MEDHELKKACLDFIKRYYSEKGEAPPVKVMCEEVEGLSRRKFYEFYEGGAAEACKLAGIPVDQKRVNSTKRARESRKKKGSEAGDVEHESYRLTLTEEQTKRLLGISHLEKGKDSLLVFDEILKRDTGFRRRGLDLTNSKRVLNFLDEAHEKGLETPWILTALVTFRNLGLTNLMRVATFLEAMVNVKWTIKEIPGVLTTGYNVGLNRHTPEEGEALFKLLEEIKSKGWTIEKFVEYMTHYREYIWALTGASANLNEFGMSIEDFRKAALSEDFVEILQRSEEFGFKILENYESDRISKAEAERDKSIAERDKAQKYVSHLEVQTEMLVKRMDLRLRLEQMIQAYLFSKAVNPDVLTAMINKMFELDRMTTKKVE